MRQPLFSDVDYIQQLAHKRIQKQTTQMWIRQFNVWRTERGVNNKLRESETPRGNLNMVLKHFYAKVVKVNGNKYEPHCLKTMLASLNRPLQHGAPFSIRSDPGV